MIASELFNEEVKDEDEVSEKTLLREIAYFQKRLASVDSESDVRVHTMRHVYKTLLQHRKELLHSLVGEGLVGEGLVGEGFVGADISGDVKHAISA